MSSRVLLIRVSILVTGLLIVTGCERTDPEGQREKDGAEVVFPQFYQGTGSLADALAFIKVPEDRMEASLASVSRRGKLADPRQLAFANKLFSLRQSRDVELFKSLLSDGTRQQLNAPDNNKQVVHHVLRKIENGTFLYGEWDFKFFATFHVLAQEGGFIGSDLEFLSFETVKDNVRYHHRVVLRKTPIAPASGMRR